MKPHEMTIQMKHRLKRGPGEPPTYCDCCGEAKAKRLIQNVREIPVEGRDFARWVTNVCVKCARRGSKTERREPSLPGAREPGKA